MTVNQLGLLLSTGLEARLLATSNEFVEYDTGVQSSIRFHGMPDYGATFVDPRPGNQGGWIYVSNCEVRKPFKTAGVGALTFNSAGQLMDYRMLLEGTMANCAGGRTPWGSYISCEEYNKGNIWQVDPLGAREPRKITLGSDGGFFESFACDVRHRHYFVTEDHINGTLRRFIPDVVDTFDPWDELHGTGVTTHLILKPDSDTHGTYEWTSNMAAARLNGRMFYPNPEGLDVHEDQLYFVSKKLKTMFVLNLDDGTYTSHTTRRGVFDGQPDQIQRILSPEGEVYDELLYFTEDGGRYAGVHARNREGQFFSILESPYWSDETTGLAFSPDGLYMYIAYQDNGTLFEISREDGLPFYAQTLTIKYHATT